MASKSYASLIKRAKLLDYEIHLIFFWLNSVELAKERVKQRVLSGGHNITIETIERRYKSGMRNFNNIFRNIVSSWVIYDNSKNIPILVAKKDSESNIEVFNVEKFKLIENEK